MKHNNYGLKSIWEDIVKEIERTSRVYSKVNRAISFGLSRKLRIEAAEKLIKYTIILDAGCGPGDMTLTILENNKRDKYVIGLDANYNLLEVFLKRVEGKKDYFIDLVVGLFEETPLRKMSVDAIVTSFSLRDSIDLNRAIRRLSETLKMGGKYIDIDIGRPANRLLKEIFTIFLKLIPPIIASFYYGSIRNPWLTLYKTIDGIPDNRVLERLISIHYKHTELKEVAQGGLIELVAVK